MSAAAPLPVFADAAMVTADCLIEDDKHCVTLDVVQGLPMHTLARLIFVDAHLRWCWKILSRNTSTPAMRDMAMRDLRKALAGKLDIRLDRKEAHELASTITLAAIEPERCPGRDGERCSNYGIDYDPAERKAFCLTHVRTVQP